jgi:hypothetical protein
VRLVGALHILLISARERGLRSLAIGVRQRRALALVREVRVSREAMMLTDQRMYRNAVLLCFITLASVCSQLDRRSVRAASLEGDVYLVMRSGDTKRAAGNTVYLIRDSDSLQRALGDACEGLLSARATAARSLAAHPAAKSDVDSRRERTLRDSIDRYAKVAMSPQSLPSVARAADSAAAHFENELRLMSSAPVQALEEERVRNRAAIADSELIATQRVHSIVMHAVVDTVGTGVNAHFRFGSVPEGRYALFAEWVVGDNAYTWWKSVQVQAAQSQRVDLDNSSESRSKLYCGTAPST